MGKGIALSVMSTTHTFGTIKKWKKKNVSISKLVLDIHLFWTQKLFERKYAQRIYLQNICHWI